MSEARDKAPGQRWIEVTGILFIVFGAISVTVGGFRDFPFLVFSLQGAFSVVIGVVFVKERFKGKWVGLRLKLLLLAQMALLGAVLVQPLSRLDPWIAAFLAYPTVLGFVVPFAAWAGVEINAAHELRDENKPGRLTVWITGILFVMFGGLSSLLALTYIMAGFPVELPELAFLAQAILSVFIGLKFATRGGRIGRAAVPRALVIIHLSLVTIVIINRISHLIGFYPVLMTLGSFALISLPIIALVGIERGARGAKL